MKRYRVDWYGSAGEIHFLGCFSTVTASLALMARVDPDGRYRMLIWDRVENHSLSLDEHLYRIRAERIGREEPLRIDWIREGF